MKNIEKNNQHRISLSLVSIQGTSGNVIKGELVGLDSIGQYQFNNLLILSSGSFIIAASCPGASDGTSKQITIINYVKNLNITSTSPSFTAFEYFNVTINVIGDDDYYYLPNTEVYLNNSSNVLSSNPSISTTNGIGKFVVHGILSGIANITAWLTKGALNSTKIISNNIKINITQALLKVNLSPTVIFI